MKNKHALLFLLLVCLEMAAHAQDRYFTKTGKITLYSNAPLETIEALNRTAAAVLDTKSGAVQVAVLMRGFEFKKALMQEHFNENYVESNKYPKSEFRGSVVNNGDIHYTQNGTYKATVKGQLTLHGVTKPVEAPVIFTVQNGRITAVSTFSVLLSDYKISIPSLVKDKINNKVSVTIEAGMEPL